jgi:hypothetical protein
MKQLLIGTILTALTSLSAYSSDNYHLDLYTKKRDYAKKQSAFAHEALTVLDINKNNLPRICYTLKSFIDSSTYMSSTIEWVGAAANDDNLRERGTKALQLLTNLTKVCHKPTFGIKAADNYSKLVYGIYREIVEADIYNSRTYNSLIQTEK